MSLNVGMLDRILRGLVGLALIAFAAGLIYPQASWNWVGWIGIVPLLTAFLGVCPLYSVLGISTCRLQRLN